MPTINEAQTIFTVDGTQARHIAVPAGGSVTVHSNGATLYYDNASTVTSSSNDGNIATGASATFTGPQYVICAQGASTQVFVKVNETHVASDQTVSDDLTVADDVTITGDLEVDGAVNHDGTTVGFYAATPVTQAAALTAADGGTVDTTYGQDEADVISNLVTRVGEIETALVNLGLVDAGA